MGKGDIETLFDCSNHKTTGEARRFLNTKLRHRRGLELTLMEK